MKKKKEFNVVAKFDTGERTCSETINTVSHTFFNYSSNVRYLIWTDGGKDVESWAGHFGARLFDGMVIVKDLSFCLLQVKPTVVAKSHSSCS